MKPEQQALVFDIQKFSIHDGPGIRSLIFLKGCPLRCEWCANPESQEIDAELLFYPHKCMACEACIAVCPRNAVKLEGGELRFLRPLCQNCGACASVCYTGARKLSGKPLTVEAVWHEIAQDIPFYRNSGGGVTFSGGEPLLKPVFIWALGKRCKKKGVHVAVETCGLYPSENFLQVKNVVDLVLFDIKLMDEKKHIHHCVGENRQILENFSILSRLVPLIPRIPIIPGINDGEDNLTATADFLRRFSTIDTLHILPYHNLGVYKYAALGRTYSLSHVIAPDDGEMQRIKGFFKDRGFSVKVGG